MDDEFDQRHFEDDSQVIETAKDEFIKFLTQYVPDESDDQAQPLYITKLEQMAEESGVTLEIDYVHLQEYSVGLADVLLKNFIRIEPALRKAVQNVVRDKLPDYCKYENDEKEKEFYVSVVNIGKVDHLRDLKTSKLGRLSAFYGTVTRTTEVRPELFLGTFECTECSTKVYDVEQQFKYTQPLICNNPTCNVRGKWRLIREESTFLDWQRVRVQENTDEVPAGNLPRTMDVILRGNMVERAKAGDKVLFTGCLIVVPEVAVMSAPGQKAALKQVSRSTNQAEGVTGLKSLGVRELHYRLMFLASHVQASDHKSGMTNIRPDDDLTTDDLLAEMSAEDKEMVNNMSKDQDIYENLVRSLCPQVLGHHTIKQAVLLMLFGGVHKKTKEGISLRGDINVCIIGDPAVAKSQVLKYVSSFLPRAIYTSGKSSTAAGLTASVVKDSDTNEFCIEAGALMLADNGICCIDEFDKMDVKDQVAIHEAMEQQTISLAKAGISATLNARASILAAANPIGGRYDRRKTLKQNIFLPPAILSRFDLLHVMMDEPSHDTDVAIANHIIKVHTLRAEAFENVPYTTEQIQKYIRLARTIKPKITPEARAELVKAYKELRCEDAAPGSNTSYRMTVRQLEAMIRLSEALARVWLDPEVKPEFVKEAKALLRSSVLRIDLDQQLELDDDEIIRPPRRVNIFDESEPSEAPTAQEVEPVPSTAPSTAPSMGPAPSPAQSGDENAGDTANQQTPHPRPVKRPKTTPTSQPTPAAGQTPGSAAPAATPGQPAAAPEGKPAKKKVSSREFGKIKAIIVTILRQKAREAEAARGSTPDDDPMGLGSTEEQLDRVDVNKEMGMRQSDVLNQYMEHPAVKGRPDLADSEAQEAHVVLVHRIIAHLIKREGAIVVVSRPPQNEGELDQDYVIRCEVERIIALHPNFDPDNM